MGILEKEDERKNILKILKNTRKALRTDDTLLLREMSNRTIHGASVYKDPTSISIAVTIYALSKLIARKDYREHKDWKVFISRTIKDVDNAINQLDKKNFQAFHKSMKNIRESVNKIAGRLKFYIKDVFRYAKISKASRIYEHGISRSETARLLGITEFELAEYVGKTGISDVTLSLTKPIKDRIKIARSLFE